MSLQNYAHKHPIAISRIILTKIATCYSQNYAGTLGSSLPLFHNLCNDAAVITCL